MGKSDKKPDKDQQDMPQQSMHRQKPVGMKKAGGLRQSHNTSQKIKILHKGKNDQLQLPVFYERQEQAEIHGKTAQLKREIPPVVFFLIYHVIQEQLFINLACGQDNAAEK